MAFRRNISSHVKNPDLGDKNSRDIPKIKKVPKIFGILNLGIFKSSQKWKKKLDRKSAEFGIRGPENPIPKPTLISRPSERYLNVNQFFKNQGYLIF